MTSNEDILDKLAHEARRLSVARKLPDGELGWDWIGRVQQDLHELINATGITQGKVARKMAVSASMINVFLNLQEDEDTNIDLQKITRNVNQFIEIEAKRAKAPRPKDWIETEVAKRILNLIRKVVEMRSIGLIYSDPGRGKTITLMAARDIFPGAVYIRVLRGAATGSAFTRLMGKKLLRRNKGTTLDLQLELIDKFKGTDRPLIIDEAHQLNRDALEFLRDLHDECSIPIILAGTKQIDIDTNTDDVINGQFASRIAMRYDIIEQLENGGGKPIHSMDEIKALFNSDTLRLTSDGVKRLTELANIAGIGGLRLCKQISEVAAGLDGDKAVDDNMIMQVVRGMHSLEHALHRIERKLRDSKIKVA